MTFSKYKLSIPLVLFFIIILAIFVFYYPLQKPIPVGTDAVTYLNNAHWIVNNKVVPVAYQETYYGMHAYPSPLSSLNLALIYLFINLNLSYPIFSFYQLYILILIFLTSFLVGKIYNQRLAILFPTILIGSFGLSRLFLGSTISNLLVFSYINIVFYCIHKYLKIKNHKIWILIFIFTACIYFTHNYLTAPIFIPIFLFYIIFLLLVDKNFRFSIKVRLREVNPYLKGSIILFITGALVYLVYYYRPVIQEAINAFWRTNNVDKFRGAIAVSQYGGYLGQFVFNLAIVGIIFYLIKVRKNILSYRIFPLLWLIILLLILQTYRLGIDFYYERIVLLAGVFICLFTAYFINIIFERLLLKPISITLIIALLLIPTITNGVQRIKSLYDVSTVVSENQINVLNLLKRISQPDDIIFSHVNAVSQTNHDLMITDRNIKYNPVVLSSCQKDNESCLAFNSPDQDSSIKFLSSNNIKFFLFMKPGFEGSNEVERLISRYKTSNNYMILFDTSDAKLFKIKSN